MCYKLIELKISEDVEWALKFNFAFIQNIVIWGKTV
jgi:hypothetical protein